MAEREARRSVLARLAEEIRQRRTGGGVGTGAGTERCSSGWPALDAALGGGFAGGAVHELVAGEWAAAVWTVALRTAARAAGLHKWLLCLDTGGDVYPPALVRLGVPLGRLLIVRASQVGEALWAAEQALRCRAVAAVVLPLRSVEAHASRRLQLAAETGGSLGLLLRNDERGGHTFAASRLRCEPVAGRTAGRRLRITVLKLREGRPSAPFVVELSDAPDSVPASAVPVDRAYPARRDVAG